MKYYILIGLFLSFLGLKAQERQPLNGVILNYDTPLENVHIKNVTTGKYALSNSKGEFSLNSGTKDTLLISHVSMMDVVKFLSEADVAQDPLIINMVNFANELKEITIQDSGIDAVSEGIIPKKIEKLSVNERRLEVAGDFKFVHLLSILGGSLQIDPILNAINGRTKKLKKNLVIEKKGENIALLEYSYKDYMLEDMGLNEEDAAKLITFCVEEESLQNAINSKNEGRVHLFLIESWEKYKKLQQ